VGGPSRAAGWGLTTFAKATVVRRSPANAEAPATGWSCYSRRAATEGDGSYWEDFESAGDHDEGPDDHRNRSGNVCRADGRFRELHTNESCQADAVRAPRSTWRACLQHLNRPRTRTNLLDDTLLAFAGIDKLRFVAPVFIGDTVHVTKRVAERKELGAEQGTVIFETRVLNQRNEIVLVYLDKMLLKRRRIANP
jgi:hypothetical protein